MVLECIVHIAWTGSDEITFSGENRGVWGINGSEDVADGRGYIVPLVWFNGLVYTFVYTYYI